MEVVTYSTVAVTLGLVVARPRLTPRVRVTPAMAALAGVAVLAAIGSVRLADIAWVAQTMWRPLLGIVAIMAMTGVARRLGVLATVAELVFRAAKGSASLLFAYVFFFGATTAAVLNNDSAILLLTPLVIDAARRRHPQLVVPLAFAVFLSAGVAPFIVSNPMNMVVASYAGIGFNEYAAKMILPALACALVTFGLARIAFRRDLAQDAPPNSLASLASPEAERVAPLALDGSQRGVLFGLGAVVLSYPIVSWLGGPVWAVAVAGALALLALGSRAKCSPVAVFREEVHLDTLVFLMAALVLSIGLRNVGITDHLARAYAGASPMKIGIVSAMGSAVLNNHPMSHLNMFALAANGSAAHHVNVLAALVGGDLGPRLLPIGSLAGLLWLEMLRRAGVEIRVRRFLIIGAITVPALLLCLALL